jgi:hypothetical protein
LGTTETLLQVVPLLTDCTKASASPAGAFQSGGKYGWDPAVRLVELIVWLERMYAPSTTLAVPVANVGSEAEGQRHDGLPSKVGGPHTAAVVRDCAHATFVAVHDVRFVVLPLALQSGPTVVKME